MKKRSLYIRLAVCLLFFAVLIRLVRGEAFLNLIRHIDPLFFVLSVLMGLVMVSISCLKWKVLLLQQGHRTSFFYLMRIYLIGYYFSNFLPSNVGGDVVRSYYVGKSIGSQGRAAVSVFLERFTGMVLMLVLVLVAPLLIPGLYAHPAFWIPSILSSLLLGVVAWLWVVKEPMRLPNRIFSAVTGVLRGRMKSLDQALDGLGRVYFNLAGQAEKFHEKLVLATREIGSSRALFVPVAGITVVFYFCALLNVYLSFRAFGIVPDFIRMSAVIPTAMMVASFPVSVMGGLGLAELGYVGYFSLIGIEREAALAMALLLRFKMLLYGGIGLPFYLSHKHKEPDDIPTPENALEQDV